MAERLFAHCERNSRAVDVMFLLNCCRIKLLLILKY